MLTFRTFPGYVKIPTLENVIDRKHLKQQNDINIFGGSIKNNKIK
jgi:hypothetical protein